MRLALVVAFALLAAVAACAVPAEAKGELDGRRVLALGYLEPQVPNAGIRVAHLVESLHANGVDARTWPSEEDAALWRIIAPPGGTDIALLRPLRALALYQQPEAGPDGELTRNVLGRFRPDGYGDNSTLNDDAYAVLALRAAGVRADDARLQSARSQLLANQNADGGWGWSLAAPSSTDLTGMVLEALAGTGDVPAAAGANATRFLEAARQAAGGFAEAPGQAANCESTVWGLRASHRLGLLVRDEDWAFLLSLQDPDTGGFAHLPGQPGDLLCTIEAFGALGDAAQGRLPAPPQDKGGGRRGVPAPGPAILVAVLAAAAFIASGPRRARRL